MQATAYGAVDFAHEHDAFLSPSPASPASSSRRPRASLATWSKVAIGTAVAIAGVSYCVTVTSTLATQNEVIARMQQQIEAMHAVVVQSAAAAADAPSTVSTSASSSLWSVSLSTSKPLPNKFAVPHVTPLKTQDNRGTCWDFATIGPLEQTYRTQGIHNGWLKRDEYVALSEQAYGAEVLRLCAGEPGSPQQVACLIPGNQIWKNSTEGGESAELFFLQHGFENSVFPHSICPYAVDAGSDTVCPALTPQKRATNPLKLRVRRMDTLYDEASVKRALVDDARAMAFTTSMPYITYYYPCVGELLKSDPRCDAASPSCTLCPAAFPQTTCCIPVTKRENYNMAGEFITSADMQPEGGHVMTVVGYTDTFRTEQGFTGGFILKNSWWDGVHPALGPAHARGSHSIQYWLEEVSDWEERSMCPNSHDPANWYQCGETGEVIHANANAGSSTRSALAGNATEVLAECLSNETALYARTNLQPLTLRCTDATYCRTDDSVVYFATNTSDYGDRMQRMCFFEFDRATDAAAAVCLPPLLPQQIAYILTPVEAETLENDPDVCGHYLYPFEVLQQYKRQFGNFYVNNFDVEWHPQSFAANAHHYPELDYADVKASTKVQNQYAFTGPFPFARVVDKKDLPKVVATAAGDVGSAQ